MDHQSPADSRKILDAILEGVIMGSTEPPNGHASASGQEKSCMRRFGSWLKAVFITRKDYVPGDTCRSYWQKSLNIPRWYLIYRAVHTFVCFAILVISILRVAVYDEKTYKDVCNKGEAVGWVYCFMESEKGVHLNFTWPLYLARWGIMGNFAVSVMGLVFVVRGYVQQSKMATAAVKAQDKQRVRNSPADTMPGREVKFSWSKEEHDIFTITGCYWALHSVFLCLATIISMMYWGLLHADQPKGQPLAAIIAIAENDFNIVTMSIDYVLVAYPATMFQSAYYVVLFVTYGLTNFLYITSGGLDQEFKFRYMYPFLDWLNSPGIAIAFYLSLVILIMIIHCFLLLVDYYKFKAKKKYIRNIPSSAKGIGFQFQA